MLKKFGFGRSSTGLKAMPEPATSAGIPTETAHQFLARRREQLRVAVKGTLREHGMGATWVGCEVGIAIQPGQTDTLTMTLIVQEWREDLVRYLPALQAAIVLALGRTPAGLDYSQYRMTWAFAPDCGCPLTLLPPAASWSANAAVRLAPEAGVPARTKFDLPPSELDWIQDTRDDIPSSFAATQPGFLNSAPDDMPKPRKSTTSGPSSL